MSKLERELDSLEPTTVLKKDAINIIDGTWELKWKGKSSTTRHCRARLCLRGFKDSKKAELDTFANTALRTTQPITCSRAALFGWKLTALVASTAFLQGPKYGNQGRVIHLKVDYCWSGLVSRTLITAKEL
eukprot:563890-Amphidinium_carterae.1